MRPRGWQELTLIYFAAFLLKENKKVSFTFLHDILKYYVWWIRSRGSLERLYEDIPGNKGFDKHLLHAELKGVYIQFEPNQQCRGSYHYCVLLHKYLLSVKDDSVKLHLVRQSIVHDSLAVCHDITNNIRK